MALQIETFPVYPLGCNCSILYSDTTREAIVVDPGGSEELILERLGLAKLRVKTILHTHAHFDHCLGTAKVAEKFPESQICLHSEDLKLYENIEKQCYFFGVPFNNIPIREITHFLQDEEEFFLEDQKMRVLHTPGHTPGSTCFHLEYGDKSLLFSGDTLFSGSIGRTDLWGGDSYAIIQSIKERLFVLDDDTVVIPGHGDKTKIHLEKNYNPFF